jgi:hypothetical protein
MGEALEWDESQCWDEDGNRYDGLDDGADFTGWCDGEDEEDDEDEEDEELFCDD